MNNGKNGKERKKRKERFFSSNDSNKFGYTELKFPIFRIVSDFSVVKSKSRI